MVCTSELRALVVVVVVTVFWGERRSKQNNLRHKNGRGRKGLDQHCPTEMQCEPYA